MEQLKADAAETKATADQIRSNRAEQLKTDAAETKATADQIRSNIAEQLKADLANQKALLDDELADAKAESDQERALRSLFHTKVSEVSAGSIDRSRDSAKFVQTAAAALITAYVALLGLVYSVTGRTLPSRGVFTALFLGLAIALAVAYLAFLRAPGAVNGFVPGPSLAETQLQRTSTFVAWMNAAVGSRAIAMRAAVLAFGFGIAFIPAAFIGPTSPATPSAAALEVPSVPQAVPRALEEPARRLFEFQVNAYLEASDAQNAASDSPTPAVVDECSDAWSPLQGCGWSTETAVERSFRWFALYATIAILIGAVVPGWTWNRPTKRKTGSPGTSIAGPTLPVSTSHVSLRGQ